MTFHEVRQHMIDRFLPEQSRQLKEEPVEVVAPAQPEQEPGDIVEMPGGLVGRLSGDGVVNRSNR